MKGLQEGCPEMTLQQFIDHFKVREGEGRGKEGGREGGREVVQCTTCTRLCTVHTIIMYVYGAYL